MKTKTTRRAVNICKADSAEYDARFVLSASTPDRVKDTIDPAAYKPYEGKRLIALYQHNDDEPLGVWENLAAHPMTLTGDLKLAGTRTGNFVKDLLAADVPLGASIRFRAVGEPNKYGGTHFKSIELLECSIVSIPAHPRAIQIAKSYGFPLLSTEGEPLAMSGKAIDIRHRAAVVLINAKRALRGRQP